MTDGGRTTLPTDVVNPLDPTRMGRSDQIATLANLVQQYRHQSEPLTSLEIRALGAALDYVTRSSVTPTVMMVAAALVEPAEITAASLQMSEARLREVGFDLGLALRQLANTPARHDQTIWELSDSAFAARFPTWSGQLGSRRRRPSMPVSIMILVVLLLIFGVVTGIVHI